jgi:chorismate mutase
LLRYTELITAGDAEGILKLLTNTAVEEKLLKRVRLKASTYGRDIDGDTNSPASFKVNLLKGPNAQ